MIFLGLFIWLVEKLLLHDLGLGNKVYSSLEFFGANQGLESRIYFGLSAEMNIKERTRLSPRPLMGC